MNVDSLDCMLCHLIEWYWPSGKLSIVIQGQKLKAGWYDLSE